MSTSSMDERQLDVPQRDENKMPNSSPFWKRYVEKTENMEEKSMEMEPKAERMEGNIERISPLELESTSLLDWTFEEQFKQVMETSIYFLLLLFLYHHEILKCAS